MLLTTLLLSTAFANERRFVYTYETPVLPKDAIELEPWTTITPGELGPTLSQRMEMEFGITNRLQTALYFNWTAEPGSVSYDGISSEWKLNLLRRAVKPIGLALYGEVGISPSATELEAKVLLDKEMGSVIVAANLVGELEMERELEVEESGEIEVEHEQEVEAKLDLAAAYVFSSNHSLGLESVVASEFHEGELEETTIQVGPSVGYGTTAWWFAGTTLIEVAAITEEEEESEGLPYQVRFLLGFHL